MVLSADKLLKAYPVGSGTVPKTARDLMRDAAFGWKYGLGPPSVEDGTAPSSFIIIFDQHPKFWLTHPRRATVLRTATFAFVFQHLLILPVLKQPTYQAISEATATYWTNFAKHGDPNGEGVPAWPAFSDANPVVMYFSQTPHTARFHAGSSTSSTPISHGGEPRGRGMGKITDFRMKTLMLFCAMIAAGLLVIAQQPAPVESGSLREPLKTGATVYRGVPFAAPPIGDLRWRAPRPPIAWEGVRKADRFAPNPVQEMRESFGPWTAEYQPQGAVRSEKDRLYLTFGPGEIGRRRTSGDGVHPGRGIHRWIGQLSGVQWQEPCGRKILVVVAISSTTA